MDQEIIIQSLSNIIGESLSAHISHTVVLYPNQYRILRLWTTHLSNIVICLGGELLFTEG